MAMKPPRRRTNTRHIPVKAYLGDDASLVITPRKVTSPPQKNDDTAETWQLAGKPKKHPPHLLRRVLTATLGCLLLTLRSCAITLALYDAASYGCMMRQSSSVFSNPREGWFGASICEVVTPWPTRIARSPIVGAYQAARQAVSHRIDQYSRPPPHPPSSGILQKAKVRLLFPLTTAPTPVTDKWQFRNPFRLEPPKEFDQRSALDLFADPPVLGECWKFSGSRAHAGMIVRKPSSISAVSFAYPLDELLDAAHAPKEFEVWARPLDPHSKRVSCEGRSPEAKTIGDFVTSSGLPSSIRRDDCVIRLIQAQYHPSPPDNRQLFPVAASEFFYDIIILDVLSNWGSTISCIHSFSVFTRAS